MWIDHVRKAKVQFLALEAIPTMIAHDSMNSELHGTGHCFFTSLAACRNADCKEVARLKQASTVWAVSSVTYCCWCYLGNDSSSSWGYWWLYLGFHKINTKYSGNHKVPSVQTPWWFCLEVLYLYKFWKWSSLVEGNQFGMNEVEPRILPMCAASLHDQQ